MTTARNVRCLAADGDRRRGRENCAFVLMDHEHGRLRLAEPPLRFEERRPAEDVGVGRPKHQQVGNNPYPERDGKDVSADRLLHV